MQENLQWDRWHSFDGEVPENPNMGDRVEVEFQATISRLPDSPDNAPQRREGTWEGIAGRIMSPPYRPIRWRHLDQATAESWQEARAKFEAD